MTADFTGLYQSRVIRRVHLTSNHPSGAYNGKILLGEINDGVLCALEAYSETAAELVNSRNHKRGAGTQNCHDWATAIVRSLEDAMLLPQVSQMIPDDLPVRMTEFRHAGSGRPRREMSAYWLSQWCQAIRTLSIRHQAGPLYPYYLHAPLGLIRSYFLVCGTMVVSSLGFMESSYWVYCGASCCTVGLILHVYCIAQLMAYIYLAFPGNWSVCSYSAQTNGPH